ncbi:MAG: radical SAM protein [Thermococci archaeon]|nr:radical SAM protein [Thermococci archaeon]
MNVLLVSPPTDSAIKSIIGTTGPPLGLAYLASMVREEHEVRIVDSLAEDLDFSDVVRIMKRFDPDVVGITSTTSMIYDAYRVAEIAKSLNENSFVVMGGPHVTFVPERTLKECRYVDAVVRGEGELTFKELLDRLERGENLKGLPGLSYRNDGGVVNNPPRPLIKNVDDIPMPAYDLLPMERYRAGNSQFGVVMTSRGCPFNCVFCSSSLQFGKRWRGHSVERVIEELSMLRNEYGIREVEFLDDTFTLNRRRAMEIAKAIVREGLDVSWSASSRVDTFSEDVGREMKRAGCHTVYFGIESGSERTLKFIGKGITLDKAKAAVKTAKRVGLRVLGSFVIGFPDETRKDVEKTIRFSKRVGVDFAQFTIATPYPGTRLWAYGLENGLIRTFNWRRYTTLDPVLRLRHFTADGIVRMLRKAYVSFYLRPKVIVQDLIERHGFIFRRTVRALINMLRESKRANEENEKGSAILRV